MAETNNVSTKPETKPEAEEIEEDEDTTGTAETPETEDEEDEEEEETVRGEGAGEEDPEAEEEEVDESLFAEAPVLPKGNYEMELVKCAPRLSTSDERSGYRSGVEYTFEPDRSEYPDEPNVKVTLWASFYDDDKPGFKDMNRRIVKSFREAGLFPEPVILIGKPGTAKKVKMDYDENIGGMYKVRVGVEEYQGEKRNRVEAVKEA